MGSGSKLKTYKIVYSDFVANVLKYYTQVSSDNAWCAARRIGNSVDKNLALATLPACDIYVR